MEKNEKEQIRDIIKRLRSSFNDSLTRPYKWRIEQLTRIRSMINENTIRFQEALATDLGKGPFESAIIELGPIVTDLNMIISKLWSWMAYPQGVYSPTFFFPVTSEIIFEPLGVCLIIGAFNYPIALTLSPVVGAIAAGNCVVMKPSEIASASEKLLLELIPKYLSEDAVGIVSGGVATTSFLLEQKWDKIFFTGSCRVGKIVMEAAARHLTPVSLELGGKSPVIIDDSIRDMKLAVRRILWGKFTNAGQICIAPDFALCHEKVYDRFIDAVEKTILEFYGEDPQKSPDFGRIITESHCTRLRDLLAECSDSSSGAQCDGVGCTLDVSGVESDKPRLMFGGRVVVQDRYVAPTIITNVSVSSKMMQEEIFGPILPVIKVKDLDHAIDLLTRDDAIDSLNDSYESNTTTHSSSSGGSIISRTGTPLALYIFADSKAVVDKVIAKVPSGGVVVNDTLVHFGNSYLPFGGVGSSGVGAYHGWYSFECFSHRRAIVRKDTHAILDVPFRYPPYSPWARRMVEAVMIWGGSTPSLRELWRHLFGLATIAIILVSIALVYKP